MISKETTTQLQFKGHLDLEVELQPQIVATITYELHDPTTLNVDFILLGNEDEQRSVYRKLTDLQYGSLWLHSDQDHILSVEVIGIYHLSFARSIVSLVATAVQIGISKEPQPLATTWHVIAELTPSGLLITPKIRELSYTGDIKSRHIKEEGGIEVATNLGNFQVGERYAHYSSEEYGNKVTHTVQRVSVTGEITIHKDQDLHSINKSLREELADICTALSLCYRQPVNFYEIKYFAAHETPEAAGIREATLRRRLHSLEKKSEEDELIHYSNLIDGGLNRLLQAYKTSAHKKELSRAISFLASSYKMVTLESSYFLAYSALDLVVSTTTSNNIYLLSSSRWKKLQKLLREYLDSIADVEGIAAVIEQMKEKLPELRRTASDRRIMEACKGLWVKTDDLWPKEGFEIGLRIATRMRNELFHSALCESPQELFQHLVRVRTLVERLLLKVFDWPDERIWTWYDQTLIGINQD